MEPVLPLITIIIAISPSLLEIQIIQRQLRVLAKANETTKLRPSLESALHPYVLLLAQIQRTNGEYSRLFITLLLGSFVITLEMCLGLVPKLYWLVHQYTVRDDDGIIPNSVYLIILFHYEFLKYLIALIFKDCMARKYKDKSKNSGLLSKIIRHYLVGLLLLVIVCFAIMLAVIYGGKFYYVWLWIYTFFCTTIYVFFIRPYYAQLAMSSKTALADGELTENIRRMEKLFKFSRYRIFLAVARDCYDTKRVLEFSHACCYKSILINQHYIVGDTTDFETPPQTNITFRKLSELQTRVASNASMLAENLKPRTNRNLNELLGVRDTYIKSNTMLGMQDVLALVAFDFARWKLGNSIVQVIAMNLMALFWFPLFATLAAWPKIYKIFELPSQEVSAIPAVFFVLLYLLRPIYMLNRFIYNAISKHQKQRVDTLIMRNFGNLALDETLIKVAYHNGDYLMYDKWYSSYYLSEPTLQERIETLEMRRKNSKTSQMKQIELNKIIQVDTH